MKDITHEVKIASLGVYLPPTVVSSVELDRQWGLREGTILRLTGVAERRYERSQTSAGMAAKAARAAIDKADMTIADIDAIIGGSAVPQQAIPCMSALLQRELGEVEGSLCFDVNATCLGFLIALRLASLMIRAGQCKHALVYSSEKTSLSLNPKEWESAGLFGDAAVAAVVIRTPPGEPSRIGACRFQTHSSGAHLTELLGGGTLRHPNDPATRPEDNLFHMDGPGIFRLATKHFGHFLEAFLSDAAHERSDYEAVVPHQASRRGLSTLTSFYGFSDSQIVSNLHTRGNCIAASIPLALAEAVEAGRIRRGHRVLLLGTAAGLTLGALELVF